MVQLTVISDGTREGTHVLLPDGTPIAGVVGVEYALASDGDPLVSIHLVGTRVKVDVEPQFLQGVKTATFEELLAKQNQINSEIMRRKMSGEAPQEVVVQAPFISGFSTAESELAQTRANAGVVDMLTVPPEV